MDLGGNNFALPWECPYQMCHIRVQIPQKDLTRCKPGLSAKPCGKRTPYLHHPSWSRLSPWLHGIIIVADLSVAWLPWGCLSLAVYSPKDRPRRAQIGFHDPKIGWILLPVSLNCSWRLSTCPHDDFAMPSSRLSSKCPYFVYALYKKPSLRNCREASEKYIRS